MNKLILPLTVSALALTAIPASAGEPSQPYQPSQVEQSPMWQWFVGGSVSYLFEYEEPMYALHVGAKSPWSPLGFATSFHLEGGFLEDDNESHIPLGIGGIDSDLELIPVTLNVQFEKALNDWIGLYFGVGAGASFSDLKVAGAGHDHDTVFTSQAFAGVNFRMGASSEIYTGGRYIRFEDADDYDLDDSWAVEAGYRWKF
jgi:opacity protein-like surface antigen